MIKKDVIDMEKTCNNMNIPIIDMTEEDVLLHKKLIDNMQIDLENLYNRLHNK